MMDKERQRNRNKKNQPANSNPKPPLVPPCATVIDTHTGDRHTHYIPDALGSKTSTTKDKTHRPRIIINNINKDLIN